MVAATGTNPIIASAAFRVNGKLAYFGGMAEVMTRSRVSDRMTFYESASAGR